LLQKLEHVHTVIYGQNTWFVNNVAIDHRLMTSLVMTSVVYSWSDDNDGY